MAIISESSRAAAAAAPGGPRGPPPPGPRARGDPARHVGDRQAERHEIAQRLIHRQRAAGERAVGEAHAAQALRHALAAEPVFAVGHAGGRRAVGHHVQPRDRAQRRADRARVHVQQIGDDLRVFGVRERRADDAGIAVMQRRHRVEQVREAARAVLERGDRVVVRAERMAELHAHAARGHLRDDLDVPGDLRRERDHADRRDRQILQHLVERRGHRRVRLSAELAGIDVRAFEMHAEHARAARRARARAVAQLRADAHQLVARRGHRRREQARRAVARVRARDRLDRVAALHHVRAARAVHVQIDEAGQDVGRIVVRRVRRVARQRGDPAVLEFERAVEPAFGGQYVSGQHDVLYIW